MNVRIGNIQSEEKQLENGVPQGLILSVTLFALKIDGVIGFVPTDVRYHVSLCADNLQISYRHSDMEIAQKQMQKCLDKVYG